PRVLVYIEDPDAPERHVDGFTQHTDEHGRFRFEGLPDVPMELGVLVEGHARTQQRVAALDRDDVVLRPAPGAGLAGRGLDDASGAPVPSFTVHVARSLDGSFEGSSLGAGRTFADPAGAWRTDEAFGAGRAFLVEVTAPGYAAGTGRVTTSVERDPEACVV